MCGIFAAIAPKGAPPCWFGPHATKLLEHRGPDASGVVQFDLAWASVTLGMTRLKVVDQTDLVVPFDFRARLGVVLAFNGEVYNWRELRAELRGPWETQCDAEVVAALWREHGPACLDRMNGMWGLVLVDTWTDTVFAARDRAGEKPLYWAQPQAAEVVYIASEPKAFPIDLNACHCVDMDVLEFDCGKYTPICGVHAMPPGSLAVVGNPGPLEGDFGLEVGTWWRLPHEDENFRWTYERAEALVIDAIRIRHVSERPVAVQLSGGLDSAIIQAVVDSDRLYCVTFPDLDNMAAARLAAGEHDVVPVTFTLDDLLAVLPQVAYHLDTPGTWSAVCQWFMNRKIAEDGGVVVMSGEGADELWGGYARYRILHYLDHMLEDEHLADYRPLMARTLGERVDHLTIARMLNRGGPDMLQRAQQLVTAYGGSGSLVSRMARTDFYTTMQVLLRMADRMTAAFGLEGRAPFLDYRLMELAARMPARQKVAMQSKLTLRTIAERLGVPEEILNEKTKRGLAVPASWGQQLDNGAQWDRRWFSQRMRRAWLETCLRPALCGGCERSELWRR